MSSPLAELLEGGTLGPAGADLLYRSVAAVARFDRYPPPDLHQTWTTEAVTETAHDFLIGARANQRLVQLAVLATDERSFARLLEASVRNFLRSQARATERGKLRRRLVTLLESDSAFMLADEGPPVGWQLTDRPGTHWTGRIDDLALAAGATPVPLSGPATTRRDAVRDMTVRMLNHAGGSVSVDDLLGVIAQRLNLGEPPLTGLDMADPAAGTDVAAEALSALEAADVFELLTDRERLLVLVLDEPVRTAAEFAGIGKSTAADALNRLRLKLLQLLGEGEHLTEVLAQLSELAQGWVDIRTESPPPAS